MLKSIESLSKENDPPPLVYRIIDSCFVEDCAIHLKESVNKSIAPDLAVIEVYSKKKRNVSKALAQMYDYYGKKNRNLGFYRDSGLRGYKNQIEDHYPELNFGKKYYNCVLRFLKNIEARWAVRD